MFDTPVLFVVFNRPDLTEKIFARIREIQPTKLYVGADGPRKNNIDDPLLCEQTRDVIVKNIDWKCEVKTKFRDCNVGCRKAVSEAIDWFFDEVEYGIILEDDTLPELSFFNYCAKLLKLYANSEVIFHISGNNFQLSEIGNASYYLSRLPHIWGWATWRRAWNKYDAQLKSFNENEIFTCFKDPEIDLFWKQHFISVKNNLVDTWDYQWAYTLFKNEKYALLPQHNLVKNIGFDKRSFRTSSPDDYFANLKTYQLEEIIHPETLLYNATPDINLQKHMGWSTPIYENRLSGTTALKTFLKIAKRFVRG